jgi:CRP/FNR family transcriptional regulator, cyclic AMP receptor protein
VILSSSVKVHAIRPDGTEVILAVLGPGEVVGEMSLADSLARSADVSTLEELISLGTGHPLNGELTQTSLDASIMLVRFHQTR